jgi:hypothetical protein
MSFPLTAPDAALRHLHGLRSLITGEIDKDLLGDLAEEATKLSFDFSRTRAHHGNLALRARFS